ncbi:VanZ family protein [Benzoatithermus flavus]|uniref:VanZ family protein n=1 Tax=Benzoatithermus flavus TaxID=3108223 RepID=A0ABU8XS26_9PROT
MAVQAQRCRQSSRPGRAAVAWTVLVALLSLATFLVFTTMQRFTPVPSSWPRDPRFATLAAGADPAWEVEGDPAAVRVEQGTLHVRNDDPEATVGLRQVWPLDAGAPRVFRLAATVASRDIAGTRAGFRVGEVTLIADRAIGRAPLRAIHRLVALGGTRAPARYVALFQFPSGAREVELAVRLRHATGELTVKDLELKAYEERRPFTVLRTFLRASWTGVLAVGGLLFWRGVDHRPAATVLVAVAGAGLVLLMMPESLREATLEPLARLVPNRLFGEDGVAYAGHFAIFAVAGFLLRLSRRAEPWPRQVLLLIGLAGLTELLQFLTELRSPTLDDWFTNAVGALAGWLPAAWLRHRQDGQFATQRRSSTTLPPQAAKQRR